MNHKTNPFCDICGCEVRKTKLLKKVKGLFYCQKCYVENRKKHREQTLEGSEDRDKIIELEKQGRRESNLKRYVKKNGHLPRTFLPKKRGFDIKTLPKIKGQINKMGLDKSSSYLTLEEKQSYFRILMKRGLNYEEATKRMNNIIKEQKRVREFMKSKNKSESEIKKAELNLMEGLLR